MSRPRDLRTDTVTPWSARMRANWLTRSSDGRSNGIPAASLSGSRFTLPLIPASSSTRRRASSGVSLTSFSRTYSKVMRSTPLQREAAAGVEQVDQPVLAVDRHETIALLFGGRVQRDGQVRHQRLGGQPLEIRQDADRRQRDPPRRHRQPALVGQHPQRLHRLVVVVERLAHPHQDDVEAAVEQAELAGEHAHLTDDFPGASDCGRCPSCRSGRTHTASRSRPGVDTQKVARGSRGPLSPTGLSGM